MIINIAGMALTELGLPKVDRLLLHNCASVALMSEAEMGRLTSEVVLYGAAGFTADGG